VCSEVRERTSSGKTSNWFPERSNISRTGKNSGSVSRENEEEAGREWERIEARKEERRLSVIESEER